MFERLTQPRHRNRLVYAAMMALVIVLGIGSRKLGPGWPRFVTADLGDILWTFEAYLAIGFVRPRWPSSKVCVASWLVSLAVELSQLYHAPWIDAIRATTLGALLLGHGFVGWQLAHYGVGALTALLLETAARQRRAHPPPPG